jgi:hypothetical protein
VLRYESALVSLHSQLFHYLVTCLVRRITTVVMTASKYCFP